MHFLLRLPLILLELALRGGAGAVKDLLRLVASGGAGTAERAPSAEEEAEAVAAASARREAERLAAREAAARRPEARPGAVRRRTRPARPQAVPDPEAPPPPAHVSEEATQVASFGPADGPGAALEVDPPWPNYDQHSAAEVVKRVRAGDEATRAVVLLYERSHKARKSVIAAAEAAPS
jgi:hypothetical protein